MSFDFNAEYAAARAIVEERLGSFFYEAKPYGGLYEAMRYSLLAGGKRIRPILVLKFCEASGGDMLSALNYACAIEMLHTYSLIHDDLPCMDDDDLRRGKPTNHVVYGECNAVLAGDALQAAAFETALSNRGEYDAIAAYMLACAAGADGMCGGQYLDMSDETPPDAVHTIHKLKTGALLKAACTMGVVAACGLNDTEKLAAAEKYADALGIAFQIRDDVLDGTSTTEMLGKPIGSDADNGKTTFYALYGEEKCAELIAKYTQQAKDAIEGVFADTGFLNTLAEMLASRDK